MKLYELFEDRVEEGPISNEAFAKLLEQAKRDFEAPPTKRRRRGGRRGRPPAAPLDPLNDAEQISSGELLQSLH